MDAVTVERCLSIIRELRNATKDEKAEIRMRIFRYISNDALLKITLWPKIYQTMFWKKPLSDPQTGFLYWFLTGKNILNFILKSNAHK